MNKRSKPGIEISRGRFYGTLMFLGLCLALLVARAIDLQVLRKDFYQHQGDVRHVRQVPIPASRGMILDRNGEPLAISTPVESIWCNPRELLKAPERIHELARLLELDGDALLQKLGQRSEREFVYIKRRVSPALAAQVSALELPGVELQREYRRFYPTGEVTAHVLGFTNIDDQGQEGLELSFDEWLQGAAGSKRVIKDLHGRVIENVEMVDEPHPGRDLVTSIDRRLQYLAYRTLKGAVMEFQAQSGSAVVLDVTNGEVLAMVNQPSYNPNQRSSRYESMRNRAVTDFFEPGSVIKPFTVAAALESGQFTPASMVETSPGMHQVGTFTIRDARDFGTLDMAGILVQSSNVGASKLALSMDAQHLWDVYRRFGFGEVTGSGFPGESPGMLPDHSRWREVERSAVSRGYGMSTTPLQLAQAYAVIANGGRIRAPTFVKGAANPDNAVLDPALAAQMVGMLEQVTAPDGTGHRAALANYRIAGKTGTSRKASNAGYNNRYVATFAGVAPASDPRVVVVVSVNDPATEEYYGGQIAAPAFRAIMDASLRLMDLPPDDLMDLRSQYLAGGGSR
ncbi:MAG: penicillin-binding transpeptidase domain-containing protein [Xanthomonadales bacterium]|nr:penicillin-binding transpeptidase domain-containing protein [Xanthomonadales bacterium]